MTRNPTAPPVARLTSLLCVCAIGLGLMSSTVEAADAPTAAERARLEQRLGELNQQIATLQPAGRKTLPTVDDVAVFAKAVEWILRHDEFYKPAFVKDAGLVLDAGLARAEQYRQGKSNWGAQPGRTILAYRSRVDDSLQPYAVTLPKGFRTGGSKRWPLHVVLHGRGGTLNEVSFIRQHEGKPPAEEQNWIQLDVFGRINNAYRWAGETDVFEALADVERRYKIDDRRITLWGFSMGGAGAWHLGLHHPSRWSSVGAGAGFVDFYKYQKKSDPLPEWQDRCLSIYDAVDYALNLHNVPFITYGGEVDPQLAASLTMQAAAEPLDAPLQVLIGPKMGHKFDDESLKTFMAFHAEQTSRGRPAFPGRRDVRFTTSTLKYNRCEWATIQELDVPYEPALIESTLADDGTLKITTQNIAALSIARGAADRVSLDGSKPVSLESAAEGLLPDVYFVRAGDQWRTLGYDDSLAFQENPDLHKRHNLQGPFDDAFMEPFLCVRGTGTPWSTDLNGWANWSLDRFQREHDKWMRGQVRVINDADLTDEQISAHHLVLFGDPGSNQILARIVDRLPLKWTRESLSIGERALDPATQGLALIYPNPLNPKRYVVINSGLTMHEKDFKASNAWLFPKLGDVAILKFAPEKDGYSETIEWGALFDSHWQIAP